MFSGPYGARGSLPPQQGAYPVSESGLPFARLEAMHMQSLQRAFLRHLIVYILISLVPILSYGKVDCNAHFNSPDPRLEIIDKAYSENWDYFTDEVFDGLPTSDVAILNEFGFSKDKSGVEFPNAFSEFVINVQAAYEARGIAKENQVLPGVLMKREPCGILKTW